MAWRSATIYSIQRQLIRVWVRKYEEGAFDEDAQAADLIQEYEARIAALERLLGKQTLELELLKGALKAHRGRETGLHPSSPARGISIAEGCRLMGIARSTYYDRTENPADDTAIVEAMFAICDEFEFYGYRRVGAALRQQGLVVNYKKIRRLMREHGLQPKIRRRFGRDIFSRVICGTRVSLGIGLAVVVATGVFGILFGLLAGYVRWLDNLLMRIMDGLMAFPGVLLAIALAAALGPSALNAVIALTITFTPRTARVVRSSVLVVRELPYVEAALAVGAGHGRIISRYILANSLSPLIVQLTFVFAVSILAEAILSFLGVGPPPPAPSLGNIIAEGRNYLQDASWIALFPGLAIAAAVLGLNLMGDGLRDVTDPRMRSEREAG